MSGTLPATPYDRLRETIASWLNRQNLTEQIPAFIAMAESEIALTLRDRRMIVTVTAPTDCGSIELPTDWLEAVRISMAGGRTPLRYVPLSEVNPDRYEAQGDSAARYYTIRGNTLDIRPAPAQIEIPDPPPDPLPVQPSVEVVYYARVPALSDATPTNWLLEQEPGAYIYGTLLQAAPYMIDDERVPMWTSLYNGLVQRLNNASDTATHSGGPLVRGRRGFG